MVSAKLLLSLLDMHATSQTTLLQQPRPVFATRSVSCNFNDSTLQCFPTVLPLP
ncbi:hypothetical protein PF008_g14263 [Phytophthora fragariae]|uniref:Uncharacterized protein n=1 Tax=Phytophthora fragariae TaxID=53985 RepID=A0A6G0RIE3_9STRA|nr:hypothetical protein PF008_g14263 [Phytophthora fragariae]